ncbi:MAG: 4Fe-4S binding protein, partial [bacterium]
DPYVYITYILRNLWKADFYLWTIIGFFIPLLLSFILGRVFCSWICPYNFVYELLSNIIDTLRKKRDFIFYVPKKRKKIIYLIFIIILGVFFPFLTYVIVLPGLFSLLLHQITLHLFYIVFLGFFWISVIFIFDYFFKKRIWCKFLCPTGIILGILRSKRGLRVIKNENGECKECALCSFECPLGLTPHKGDHGEECYNCGKCVDVCRSLRKKDQPLRFKFL